MKKLIALLFMGALALWAADFWQTKPFSNWDPKEVQKILTDSPWAKKVTVAMPGVGGGPGGAGGEGGGGGGRGGGRSGPQGPSTDPGISGGGGGGIAESSGAGRGGSFGGGDSSSVLTPAVSLLVICQSALPVKQATVKTKFGAEAATSPDAKTFLDREEQYYVISVDGLPAYIRPRDAEAKQLLLKQTTLTAKGKEALAPMDVQFQADGKNIDAFFLFPRTNPLTADDKEAEFVTKAGPIGVKTKFNLKSMVFNGKLEM